LTPIQKDRPIADGLGADREGLQDMGPPLNPPSMSTSIRSPPASTISTSWSNDAREPSSCRPPWLETTMPVHSAPGIGSGDDAFEAELTVPFRQRASVDYRSSSDRETPTANSACRELSGRCAVPGISLGVCSAVQRTPGGHETPDGPDIFRINV
jgi:hypothetical protein